MQPVSQSQPPSRKGDSVVRFLDAAYTVLSKAGTPLHYVEITKRAVADDILDTKGQTPEATMGARLYVDTKRPDSRFKRVGQNSFTLASDQPTAISQHISTTNDAARNALRQRLMAMPPDRFEALIGELLLALGFEEDTIHVTSYGGDGGIDVRGVLNAASVTQVNAAVQVKRWRNNVQAPVVQALRGSLVVHEQGIIVTTSKFSRGAIQEAQAPGKTRISLIDGDKLINLLMLHAIGVQSESHTVYSLDEDWWGGIASSSGSNATTPNMVGQPIGASPTSNSQANITYPLAIQAIAQGQTLHAELLNASGQIRYNNTDYTSPSAAGKAATGWKSCNGWSLWRYQPLGGADWHPIQELRM